MKERRHQPSRLPDLQILGTKLRPFARSQIALPLLYVEFTARPRLAKGQARTFAAQCKQATAAALKASLGSILRKDDLVAAGAGGHWFVAVLTARALSGKRVVVDPDIGVAAERLRRAVLIALARLQRDDKNSANSYQHRITVRCGWNVLELAKNDHPLDALRHAVRGAALVARIEEQRATTLAAVTHELRTPLTAIIGFAERLEGERVSSVQRRRYGAIITAESTRLRRLAEGLIDMGSWSAGSLRLRAEDFDLANIALEAVQAVRDVARGKRVVLSVVGSGKAIVDRDRCLQIFINLLDNAVRHSPSRGRVRISISQERDACTVVVKDQGPGFAQLVRRTLGQPFSRTADGQVGLGLALSKLLVEAHGGSLKIAGRKGSGMVCVTFPSRKLR